MARLHPGVYVEEVASGVRPIEGVGTSTAAFIGKTQMGTLNKAVLITNPQSFETNYGGFLVGFFLAHSVRQFFNNGGKSCYIVRIAGTGVAAAAIALKDRKDTPATPAKTLTISAVNEGEWGNRLDVVIKDSQEDPDNEFDMEVWRDRSDANPPLPPLLLETHNNLSMNSADGRYV